MVISNNLTLSKKNPKTENEHRMKCPHCEDGFYEPFNPKFPYHENHSFTCNSCSAHLHFDPVVEII